MKSIKFWGRIIRCAVEVDEKSRGNIYQKIESGWLQVENPAQFDFVANQCVFPLWRSKQLRHSAVNRHKIIKQCKSSETIRFSNRISESETALLSSSERRYGQCVLP